MMATRIGIIRCDAHSENCAGFNCFPALREKTGQFERYEEVELVGFDTCGGCGCGKQDKVILRAQRLKEKGANVIHFGTCLAGTCPFEETYVQAIQDKVGISVVRGTHPRR